MQEIWEIAVSGVVLSTEVKYPHRSSVTFASRMQLLGSLNSCPITRSSTHTSDV
jgi:hypothetical protein